MAVKRGCLPNRSIYDPAAYRWEFDADFIPRGIQQPERRRRKQHASRATKDKRAQRDRWDPVKRQCESLRRAFKLNEANGIAKCANAAVIVKRFEERFGFAFGSRRPRVGQRCKFIPAGRRTFSELKSGIIFAIHYFLRNIRGKTVGVPQHQANEYQDERTFVFLRDNNNDLVAVPMTFVTAVTQHDD